MSTALHRAGTPTPRGVSHPKPHLRGAWGPASLQPPRTPWTPELAFATGTAKPPGNGRGPARPGRRREAVTLSPGTLSYSLAGLRPRPRRHTARDRPGTECFHSELDNSHSCRASRVREPHTHPSAPRLSEPHTRLICHVRPPTKTNAHRAQSDNTPRT